MGEGRYRLRLVTGGDRLTGLAYFIRIPEAFSRRYEEMRSVNTAIGIAGSLAFLILYGVGGMAIGLFLLFGAIPALVLIILLYGAGYGISWVGRGTLPLALFGPVRFPRLMGKLAFPSLIIQALAPSAGAVLLEAKGAQTTIGVLTIFAIINVVLIGLLWWLCCKPATDNSQG